MSVVALEEVHRGAWLALFEACACPCYCRYWEFAGTKNEWLDRCANALEENRRGALPEGLVALDGDRVVGWMKLASRVAMNKLVALAPYRSLAREGDARVWSIGCFLVDPAHRRRGVARRLVEAAPQFVSQRGGLAIEAYPRRTNDALHDEEAWMGPESLYRAAGFALVKDEAPYPVYRRALP